MTDTAETEIQGFGKSHLPLFFDDNFFMDSEKFKEDFKKFNEESQLKRSPKEVDIFAENKRYIEELERAKQEQISELKPEKLSYIGQALNSFLIFERGQDLFLVDQHAAHERILYNKLVYNRLNAEKLQKFVMGF